MAPGSQAGPPVILLLLFFLLHASALEPMEVRVGVAVVLPCSAPLQMDLENLVLEWTREDLRDTYMFFFRDGRPYLQYQDPLFKDRVELQDPDMKVSLCSTFERERKREE
uniref:Uncharacterized protein n=1 Tax=Knipowitschia caucasica TaxID=637954 RepID=A0AAV2J1L7_KNICA